MQNAFFCTFSDCAQYNGFNNSGDYNWRDPKMSVREGDLRTAKTNAELTSNGLCHGCNLNQELKIRQLAKFNPVNANREEEELEKYRKAI